jgi:hypothetical protein
MTAQGAGACLLDANVLVALADAAHVHHPAAVRWFLSSEVPFATCPITQGALVRLMLRLGTVPSAAAARGLLEGFTQHPRHQFWSDDVAYADIDWRGVVGHRQVTDAYLAALARRHGGRLASFDRGLAALHADVVVLVDSDDGNAAP